MLRTLALTALLLGVCSASAVAGTITPTDGRLVFAAADGETNHLTLWMIDTGPVIVRDTRAPLTGCGPWSNPDWPEVPDDLMCIGGSPKVTLGDGDDVVSVIDAGTEIPIGPAEVDGGAGKDTITTAMSDDTIRVRDGEVDTVDCGFGTDTVVADREDKLTGCENVDVPPLPEQPKAVTQTPAPAGAAVASAPETGPRGQISAFPDLSGRDRVAPKLRVSARGRTLTLRADEPCTVTLTAGGKRLSRRLVAGKAVKVRVPGRARRVTLTARDVSGNAAAVSKRLR